MDRNLFERVGSPLVLACAAAWATAGTAVASTEPTARYEVIFERTWSSETHPEDFPLLAHFSPVIGATHAGSFALFASGAQASAGVEKLCEEGKHQPLDDELRSAMARGDVGSLIETDEPIRSAPGQAKRDFEIDERHPMVSIAAMIAPSPDWCAVASGVALRQNGRWLDRLSVDLLPWDAGTDSATRYRARDADMQPRGPVQPSDSPYFLQDGRLTPVGRVTFVRR